MCFLLVFPWIFQAVAQWALQSHHRCVEVSLGNQRETKFEPKMVSKLPDTGFHVAKWFSTVPGSDPRFEKPRGVQIAFFYEKL